MTMPLTLARATGALAVILLAGCGDDSSDDGPTSTTNSTTAATSTGSGTGSDTGSETGAGTASSGPTGGTGADSSDTGADTETVCPVEEFEGLCYTIFAGNVTINDDGSMTATEADTAVVFAPTVYEVNGGFETLFVSVDVVYPVATEGSLSAQVFGYASAPTDNMWGELTRQTDDTFIKTFAVNNDLGELDTMPFTVTDPDGTLNLQVRLDRIGSPQVTVYDPDQAACSGADSYDDADGQMSMGPSWGFALGQGVTVSNLQISAMCGA